MSSCVVSRVSIRTGVPWGYRGCLHSMSFAVFSHMAPSLDTLQEVSVCGDDLFNSLFNEVIMPLEVRNHNDRDILPFWHCLRPSICTFLPIHSSIHLSNALNCFPCPTLHFSISPSTNMHTRTCRLSDRSVTKRQYQIQIFSWCTVSYAKSCFE